jgi:SAM-dependent methyltransferase
MPKSYDEDLAYVHDKGFGDFARKASPGLLGMLRRSGVPDGLIVDLGCGSGIWARELSDAGYKVHGIDISSAMIRIARRRVPEGRFRTGSFLRVPLPQCDAVTSIGECLGYLFDGRGAMAELRRLFRRIHGVLGPGGVLIFDLLEPRHRERVTQERGGWDGEDWATIVQTEEDGRGRVLTRRITSFRKVGRLYRRDHEVHRLRLYQRSEVAMELRRIGFRVRFLRGYGSLVFRRQQIGFLAQKV